MLDHAHSDVATRAASGVKELALVPAGSLVVIARATWAEGAREQREARRPLSGGE